MRGTGDAVVKYVISPQGWEMPLSGAVTALGEVSIEAGMSMDGGGVAEPFSSTSWGSRSDGFNLAVAATATEMFETSGEASLLGSNAWRRSSGDSSVPGSGC